MDPVHRWHWVQDIPLSAWRSVGPWHWRHWESTRCGGCEGIGGAVAWEGVPAWQAAQPAPSGDERGRWQLRQWRSLGAPHPALWLLGETWVWHATHASVRWQA